jgi:hypothetical protein
MNGANPPLPRKLVSFTKTTLPLVYVYQMTVLFKEIYCTDSIYTVCTKINYTIVPVTNLNKYLQYDTSGTE